MSTKVEKLEAYLVNDEGDEYIYIPQLAEKLGLVSDVFSVYYSALEAERYLDQAIIHKVKKVLVRDIE
jgi:hypothetical protein